MCTERQGSMDVPAYNPKKRQERKTEAYLKKRCHDLGIFTRKLKWIGVDGAPDRLLAYGGVLVFVEIKDDNGKLSSAQDKEILEMRGIGLTVWVVYSTEMVDIVLRYILNAK
jgi:hypothetical protein